MNSSLLSIPRVRNGKRSTEGPHFRASLKERVDLASSTLIALMDCLTLWRAG